MAGDGAAAAVDRLFRHEAGRMVARLTRLLGPRRFDLAEEAVQEALCSALQSWPFHGIPDHPAAWLMRAARNRAIDRLRRERRFREVEAALAGEPADLAPTAAPAGPLHDDRLALMFSCCHPRLAVEARLALVLKALCGVSLGEIAAAFFAGAATIEKRVTRAKSTLKRATSLFDLDDRAHVEARLGAVHHALYLLFSEGYHSLRADAPVRAELCHEAIRLARLLAGDAATRTPATEALLALMHFGLARLAGRVDEDGVFLPLVGQDRARWDAGLVALGFRHLDAAAAGTELSRYHLEAAIAAEHCRAASVAQTDWPAILRLYDLLCARFPGPIAAFNRAIALGEVEGPAAGLAALQAMAAEETLRPYPFFHAALGETRLRLGELAAAAAAFGRARDCARSPAEQRFYARRLHRIDGAEP